MMHLKLRNDWELCCRTKKGRENLRRVVKTATKITRIGSYTHYEIPSIKELKLLK